MRPNNACASRTAARVRPAPLTKSFSIPIIFMAIIPQLLMSKLLYHRPQHPNKLLSGTFVGKGFQHAAGNQSLDSMMFALNFLASGGQFDSKGTLVSGIDGAANQPAFLEPVDHAGQRALRNLQNRAYLADRVLG